METIPATTFFDNNGSKILVYYRQICSLLFANDPTTLGECDAWIVEYTDDIIELLVNQYLDPEQVCTAIEFCP